MTRFKFVHLRHSVQHRGVALLLQFYPLLRGCYFGRGCCTARTGTVPQRNTFKNKRPVDVMLFYVFQTSARLQRDALNTPRRDLWFVRDTFLRMHVTLRRIKAEMCTRRQLLLRRVNSHVHVK